MQVSEDFTQKKFLKNSTIIISEWTGRLGNNLIQLSNALFLCLRYNCKLDYPSHKYIKPHQFDFQKGPAKAYYSSYFYDTYDCRGEYPTLAQRRFIFQNYIWDLIKFNLEDVSYKSPEKELAIHIRSGDIFTVQNHTSLYVPPPLSYYETIIDQYPDWGIKIISTDRRNPCINAIQGKYPKCSVQTSDLATDIFTVNHATHLVLSVGTFGLVWAMCSRRLQRLFVNDIPKGIDDFGFFKQKELGLDFEVDRYQIKNYTSWGQWQNSSAQVQKICTHPQEEILKIELSKKVNNF